MQIYWAHLLTREDTKVKEPPPPPPPQKKAEAKFTLGTVMNLMLYVSRNTKLAHTLSIVEHVAVVSFPP